MQGADRTVWASIHRGNRKAVAGTPSSTEPMRATMALQAKRAAPMHDIGGVPIAEVAQRKQATGDNALAYQAPNRTGLPDRLRAGVEARSGLSMDQVRVHFGSSEPARLNAHAFTRRTDIHLAPGQERHLPHEAWHVVQQAQGRVRPTMSVAGQAVNDDTGLEREADTLGTASAAHGATLSSDVGPNRAAPVTARSDAGGAVQRVVDITDGAQKKRHDTSAAAANLIAYVKTTKVGKQLVATLETQWEDWIHDEVIDPADKSYTERELLDRLKKKFLQVRPGFTGRAETLAKINYGKPKFKPGEEDAAMPHRFSFNAIKGSTERYISGQEDESTLDRWSGRIIQGTKRRRDLTEPELDESQRKKYKASVDMQVETTTKARENLKNAKASGQALTLFSPVAQEFLKQANSLHGNVPDYGPHSKINIPVSDRLHLNILSDGTLTPGSEAAGNMTPGRSKGIATTSDGQYIVTTDGHGVAVSAALLKKKLHDVINKQGLDKTTIDSTTLRKRVLR